MLRRQFLASSLATSALALSGEASAQPAPKSPREFYLVRRYHLQTGPQLKQAESYFAGALLPALGRMGMGPIGVFKLDYGPETPTYCVVIPGPAVQPLVELDQHLAADADFLKQAQPFWSAAATAPAFDRVDVSLLGAFEGWPKLVPPASSATKAKRIFQLRTYESPSYAAHVRKVEMFNNGEFEIFKTSGMNPMFFGDTLVGPRMPSLTYMLSFTDLADLERGWKTFAADPVWVKLKASPRYAYEEIVSNITNVVLSPLGCSQV